MSWVWLANLSGSELLTSHAPPLTTAEWQGGHLCAWPSGRKPHTAAARADAAFIDPEGPATDITVQIIEPGREPLFDDPSVQGLLRALARYDEPGLGAMTTLTRDSSHWAGAVFVGHVDFRALGTLGPVHYGHLRAGFASSRRQVLTGTQRNAGAPWPATG